MNILYAKFCYLALKKFQIIEPKERLILLVRYHEHYDNTLRNSKYLATSLLLSKLF
jgi:hypothetical protein